MDKFYRALDKVRQEIIGKEIAIPGHKSVGRVVRVDEEGAWLEGPGNFRITAPGLLIYQPVIEAK